MNEKDAREMLKELFERHKVSEIQIVFFPNPIRVKEDHHKRLEDAGLGHLADAVTITTITKWSFNENPITGHVHISRGECWIEFYGLPSDEDIRQAFKQYLEHLGIEYIRKRPEKRGE